MDNVRQHVLNWYEMCDKRFTNHYNNEHYLVHLFENLQAEGVREHEIEHALRTAFKDILGNDHMQEVDRVVTLLEGMAMYCHHKER
ncbi:hypothetical protein NMT30_000627 [Vibrio cholerae]|uniref:hypothetical protein n=1 Tax=Vibrio cholerae TaxID=666 RepID=UPI000218FA7D|nr:hypothetical protein [Vibrio cholerae]AWB69750.1 hypothetical protein Sa5Y_VC00518 [Vibrio cholerae]EGQ8358118.1 hypothetical protein [Vibrio cholerae]EGQ9610126.1 hypothetical protein [Vibrio cholerae]EGR00310.1 hypothetical protein VCHE39_3222 [Vibrio cholerae HE39]EGR0619695.1 hypothetical protein [Vibrio cholerae]